MMDMNDKYVKCVVVTPEMAVLDESAEFVALPMYDGELGILPGRSPLIGRLGAGELRLKKDNAIRRFFVDGGFVQIRGDVVTLLTEKAVAAENLNVQAAETELQSALSRPMKTAHDMAEANKAQLRARAKRRMAEKNQ